MATKNTEIDSLLNSIFKKVTLKELFEKRLYELKVTQTSVEKLIGVGHKPLNGLLNATQKRVNYLVLSKLATFLNKTTEEIVEIHLEQLEDRFSVENTPSNKKKFIKENFDLTALRKAGLINTIIDFDEIEIKIKNHLSLNSIFDYQKREFTAAFWSGIVSSKNTLKNTLIRDFWLSSARNIILKLDNPHHYDRDLLIRYFPEIRWNSTNVEIGLLNVIRSLFKLGVTVIIQSPLAGLQLRGATFSLNEKPCIVLTNYMGFYPTLWHSLIHELYHVLFDLKEIKANTYHISDYIEESLTLDEKEVEADDFAKRYLFSEEKMIAVKPYMRNELFVKEIAKENNIHESIIYVYHAYEYDKTDRLAWVRARRHMPEVIKAISRLEFPFNSTKSIEAFINTKKLEIYN